VIVGGLAGGAAQLVATFAPHAIVVAVAFGLSVALTGAIHVDGFLDTCDAAFSGASPERRREILKDPHHGSFAIAYFAVAAVLWLAALWSLPVPWLAIDLAAAAFASRALALGVGAWYFVLRRSRMNGDAYGFTIVCCEIAGLIVVALVQRVP
jgi:cobalamin synthase